MRLAPKFQVLFGLGLCALVTSGLMVNAQIRPKVGPAARINRQEENQAEVVIEREPAALIPPKTYQVPLELVPAKQLILASQRDGRVQRIRCEVGASIASQAEALRLDDKAEQLILERAAAQHRAAEIELRRAKRGKDTDLIEIAEAKQAAAKAELDLAQFRLDQAIVRAPFAGVAFRVHAMEGQWVRAGEPLVELVDTKKLHVEIPIDRQDKNAEKGKTLKLKMEDTEVEGVIEEIYPPSERFHPLRDIVDSVASAIVVIDNADGKLAVGQTVHTPLVPRQPVVEVAKSSVNPQGDGKWKIQVLRKGIVKDLTVESLGRLGETRMYVTGAFAQGDEVITKTSQELPDGTQVSRESANAARFSPGGRRLPSRIDDDDDPS